LEIEHIQGDPYAPASRMKLTMAKTYHPLFGKIPDTPHHRLATEELFLREFAKRLPGESMPFGDGPGGRLKTVRPGAQIRRRSAVTYGPHGLTLRFSYSFPAHSRRIMGEPAGEVLGNRLTGLSMDMFEAVTLEKIEAMATHLQHRAELRRKMDEAGLVAFFAEGSVAARDADGKPIANARPLKVPADLATEIVLDDGTKLRGLGIPKGITVLAGSAFHGKTTLLEAISEASNELSMADGLANACSVAKTEFVCVEENRSVAVCDLSPFFRSLPGQDPTEFVVDEASGATSQAANLHETLASGAELLLVDEDASAANFLTRDPRMASLLPKGESVVPFVARARELAERGVSLVVVRCFVGMAGRRRSGDRAFRIPTHGRNRKGARSRARRRDRGGQTRTCRLGARARRPGHGQVEGSRRTVCRQDPRAGRTCSRGAIGRISSPATLRRRRQPACRGHAPCRMVALLPRPESGTASGWHDGLPGDPWKERRSMGVACRTRLGMASKSRNLGLVDAVARHGQDRPLRRRINSPRGDAAGYRIQRRRTRNVDSQRVDVSPTNCERHHDRLHRRLTWVPLEC